MSKDWLREHHSDEYVKRSRLEGYASRAAYKLLELNEKDCFLRPGMTVLDLGAAPGGWSQVAAQRVGLRGRVIATDLLSMDPIQGVSFLQGDFSDQLFFDQILDSIKDAVVDLVLSDMAPNIAGNKHIDQPRSLYLVELAFDCACRVLGNNGTFVAKVFQGEGMDALLLEIKQRFKQVKIRKPKASRSRSSEIYIVASQFLYQKKVIENQP